MASPIRDADPHDPGRPPPARCPGCGATLEAHQPDEELPDRLLGTCPDCHRWYLLDVGAGSITLVPELDGP